MKRWLLDTDVCIRLLANDANTLRVVDHLDRVERSQVFVSSITAAELHFGAQKSARPADNVTRLERFLIEFEVAEFGATAAEIYGGVRARLGPLDTLIAAHAITLKATVVTHNVREFRRVKGLKVADWLA
ncbi:MAG: PIN domain-containing protein [Archangium sp.]